MGEGTDGQWSVVKTSLYGVDIAASAPALSRLCDMPLVEATQRLRSSRGILMRGLDETLARELTKQLDDAGQRFLAVPDTLTVQPPAAYQLRNASATATDFTPLKDLPPQPEPVPWSRIWVITVGRVAETQSQLSSARDRPMMPSISGPLRRIAEGGLQSLPSVTHTRERVDIVCGIPEQRYRVENGRFNFGSILPKPSPVADANFCLLARGLLQMAPRAATNVLPAHIGADGGLALEEFREPHDMDRITTWLCCLVRLGLWPGAVENDRDPDGAENRTVHVYPSTNSTETG